MQSQKYLIKWMVCERCIHSVRKIAEDLGLLVKDIKLGEVAFDDSAEKIDENQFEAKLNALGFMLLRDKKKQILLETKQLVAEIYSGNFDFPQRFRFSEFASNRFKINYETISTLFSISEGITLEKYIINYRLEKIKEQLLNTDNSLSHISFLLGFSSVAHLSKHFKEQTGFNTSYFRDQQLKKNFTKKVVSEA